VDNGSTDQTKSVVDEFAITSNLNIKYAYEPKQGLSYARNKGIKESSGNIIVFTDDDVIVDKFWIWEIIKESKSNENIQMFYGQTKKYYPDLPELSIKESDFKEYYEFPCSPWSIGHGNNMIMRSSLIRDIGNFDTYLGAGTSIGAAEDTDYTYRVLKARRKIMYSPFIIVYHNHNKMSQKDVNNIEFNYAKGRGAFYCKYIIRMDMWVLRLFYREARALSQVFINMKNRKKKVILNMIGLINGFTRRVMDEMFQVYRRN
jgi:glycosyltransferase involved in cell wall biosynthesis